MKQETHRPSALKQVNKLHKTGRHRSKGAIRKETKGKINVKVLSKHVKRELGKEARRHQSEQIRKKKRDQVLIQKRNLGSSEAAPIVICIVPLRMDLDVDKIVNTLITADETSNVAVSPCGITHISLPRFKQRFSLIVPPFGNEFTTLDAIKVATTVLFVSSPINDDTNTEYIDLFGETVIGSSLAQGLPTTMVAITNIENLHPKKRHDCKEDFQNLINKWLPDQKVFQLDKASDALNILRRAGTQKQKTVFYRKKRPYLLSEQLKFNTNEGSTDIGTLQISGYLDGVSLSVNSLVHIIGLGDFQMSEIHVHEDPYPIDKNRQRKNAEQFNVSFHADPEVQESLESENIPDPMDAEQTWPTEEELAEAKSQRKKKIVKRICKGTSEYQAAWMPDEDGVEISESSEDESENMCVDEAKSESDSDADTEDNEEYETMTMSEAPPDQQRYDEEMDLMEERQAMEKIKEAKLDAQFPDEIDTPQDVSAKVRFQKYQGLASFRTSPWQPKEDMPIDYARIFKFENFDQTRRWVFKKVEDVDDSKPAPGSYITITVVNVRRDLFDAVCLVSDRPLIVFGLLPYEHKISLLNVVLKHSNLYQNPVKSKERLVFQCGFRRFTACPVFSQHTNGNKHKYERFLHTENTVVASMYAPVTYPPCPVLCFVERKNGQLTLLATGSVLSVDPDRLIIKRIVLSGHPFKVNKRSAVIRFMFFNRDDINWFKPVELRTKYGRRGHIKEPLGTHGHMKCVFNGQLKSQDTILMNLYKRVFPKWTYEPCLLANSQEVQEKMNLD